MPKVAEGPRIRATITADHKLVADVPSDMPPGEVEVVVLPLKQAAPKGNARAVQAALLAAFEKFDKLGMPRRTAAEIDAELASFRDEWE